MQKKKSYFLVYFSPNLTIFHVKRKINKIKFFNITSFFKLVCGSPQKRLWAIGLEPPRKTKEIQKVESYTVYTIRSIKFY